MRKSKKTLKGFLDDVLNDMGDGKPRGIHKEVFESTDIHCVSRAISFMQVSPGNRYLCVGKSMGGVRVWWMLTKFWSNIKHMMGVVDTGGRRPKLSVVLIDPHGNQSGDGSVGSYGVSLSELWYSAGWSMSDVRFSVVYQRNKYPKGAKLQVPSGVENVTNVRLGSGANHWNVTEIDSETGRIVANLIQDEIRWVEG